jgi:hypothetical protein
VAAAVTLRWLCRCAAVWLAMLVVSTCTIFLSIQVDSPLILDVAHPIAADASAVVAIVAALWAIRRSLPQARFYLPGVVSLPVAGLAGAWLATWVPSTCRCGKDLWLDVIFAMPLVLLAHGMWREWRDRHGTGPGRDD